MYPLGIGPDDENMGKFLSFIVSRRKRHFTGQKRRTDTWVDETLSKEDREFVLSEYMWTGRLGRLIRGLDCRHEDHILRVMLLFKYFHYDTSEDFMLQYEGNMQLLEQHLLRLVKCA
jgi:hypothetical protein